MLDRHAPQQAVMRLISLQLDDDSIAMMDLDFSFDGPVKASRAKGKQSLLTQGPDDHYTKKIHDDTSLSMTVKELIVWQPPLLTLILRTRY